MIQRSQSSQSFQPPEGSLTVLLFYYYFKYIYRYILKSDDNHHGKADVKTGFLVWTRLVLGERICFPVSTVDSLG